MSQKHRPSRCVTAWFWSLLLSLGPVMPVMAQESSADARARETEQQMMDDERFSLVYSLMPVVFTAEGGKRDPRVPAHVLQTAGWVKGVPRLGVPDLLLTDAGLGITNPQGGRPGGGSIQVERPGGFALRIPLGGEGVLAAVRRQVFIAPGPLAELKKLLPQAAIIYNSGEYPTEAATLARRSDVVILVATKFESEGFDSPDLSLPLGQDALIDAVASANPNTIVVLQTGNPVDMP